MGKLGKRQEAVDCFKGGLGLTGDGFLCTVASAVGENLKGQVVNQIIEYQSLKAKDAELSGKAKIKDLELTGEVQSSFKLRGYAASKPSMLVKYPSHTTDIGTGAQTLTIAQILTGIILCDPTAAATHTTPTAALTVAGVTGVAVGDTIDFHLLNTGTAGEDETITVAAGTGVTLVGFADVENSVTTHDAFSVGSSHWRIRFTNVTSGSEAYTIYRLA
ncbi:hypothetical protein CPAV1605_496 [seawater metagenome]|uniref:Uncharacterized protein n=1 Tax=seawater metagenome TaxID=1561972 RepID=A0A5E8CHQ5_9ZZZZ